MNYEQVKHILDYWGQVILTSKENYNGYFDLDCLCGKIHLNVPFDEYYDNLHDALDCIDDEIPNFFYTEFNIKQVHKFLKLKRIMKNENYILLDNLQTFSTSYDINYKCANDHIVSQNYQNFMKGSRCKKCSINKLSNNTIHKFFNDNNQNWIEGEYINNKYSKLIIQCKNCNNKKEITLANAKRDLKLLGHICKNCKN